MRHLAVTILALVPFVACGAFQRPRMTERTQGRPRPNEQEREKPGTAVSASDFARADAAFADGKPTSQSETHGDDSARVPLGQPTYVLEAGDSGGHDGFAKLTVDVPMTLGARGGTPIGWLRKGTRIKVVAEPEGGTISVAAPFVAVSRFGGFRAPVDPTKVKDPLFVTIDVKTSEDMSKRLAKLRLSSESSDARFGLFRELSASPMGAAFAFVNCGRVRILERKEQRWRVVFEADAGELQGWIDAAPNDERDEACNWNDGTVLPRGYVRPELESDRALIELATQKGEIFWGPRKGELAKCERWVFAPGKDPSAGWLVLDDGIAVEATGTSTERSYNVYGGVVSLGGLLYRQRDAAVVAGGKVDFFAVVRARPEAFDVLEWEPQNGRDERPLLGYRTSAVKSWFRTRAACESTLAKPSRNR
ncbi:MAG: hypothetical protein QM784_29005 [Polyangiaceae bacterium]